MQLQAAAAHAAAGQAPQQVTITTAQPGQAAQPQQQATPQQPFVIAAAQPQLLQNTAGLMLG